MREDDMNELRRDPRLDTRRHGHTWRVVDLRTASAAKWHPWRDWKATAWAMRGVEKRTRTRGVKA